MGCFVVFKKMSLYKNNTKKVNIICPACRNMFNKEIDMGYNKKGNCDVDLTVDAIEEAKKSAQFYLFTGDGDFEYLIKRLILREVKVRIVSTSKKIRKGDRYYVSRFSTKLRDLCSRYLNMMDFIEINNLKLIIEKRKRPRSAIFSKKDE